MDDVGDIVFAIFLGFAFSVMMYFVLIILSNHLSCCT